MLRPICVSTLALLPLALSAQQPGGGRGAGIPVPPRIPAIEERIAGMQKIDGYFPLVLGRPHRHPLPGNRALRRPSSCTRRDLRRGSARTISASIADSRRGGKIVTFQRVGPRVLMVQGNESFRSSSANPAERKSVEDSFAKSVLWGFAVSGEIERPGADRCHRFLPARRTRRGNALRPGDLSRGSHAQRLLHGAHEKVSRRTPRSKSR